jgi:DNA repair exonuclease SbcCD ATPase subunit
LKEVLSAAERANILAQHEVSQLRGKIKDLEADQALLRGKVELFRTAIDILQQLVDAVLTQNIKKVENLVNIGLSSIFKDQVIQFRVDQSIKRNQVLYNIVITQDGVEGGINSFGGGVFAVVAIVLKALVLTLSKKYPILVFDESLSFVSSDYRESVSKFLHDLTKPLPDGLGIPVLMITHDPELTCNADTVYQISSNGKGVNFKREA